MDDAYFILMIENSVRSDRNKKQFLKIITIYHIILKIMII